MTPFAERVLEEIRKFHGEPVRAGIIAARLNVARRTVYNYLVQLYENGLVVRPSPRKWCAA